MAKLTKKEIVRRYAEKNPTMTARQMASDLDMTPAYVNTALWSLRKEGKAPVSTRTNKKIKDTINEWEGKEPTKGFAPAPVKNEPGKLEFQEAINKRRIELLEEQIHNQTIIIKYLEKRLDEEKAKGS